MRPIAQLKGYGREMCFKSFFLKFSHPFWIQCISVKLHKQEMVNSRSGPQNILIHLKYKFELQKLWPLLLLLLLQVKNTIGWYWVSKLVGYWLVTLFLKPLLLNSCSSSIASDALALALPQTGARRSSFRSIEVTEQLRELNKMLMAKEFQIRMEGVTLLMEHCKNSPQLISTNIIQVLKSLACHASICDIGNPFYEVGVSLRCLNAFPSP